MRHPATLGLVPSCLAYARACSTSARLAAAASRLALRPPCLRPVGTTTRLQRRSRETARAADHLGAGRTLTTASARNFVSQCPPLPRAASSRLPAVPPNDMRPPGDTEEEAK